MTHVKISDCMMRSDRRITGVDDNNKLTISNTTILYRIEENIRGIIAAAYTDPYNNKKIKTASINPLKL